MSWTDLKPIHDLNEIERDDLHAITSSISTFMSDFTAADDLTRSRLLIILLEYKPSLAKTLLPMPRKAVPDSYQKVLHSAVSEMITARKNASFEKSIKFCLLVMRRKAAGVNTSKAIEEVAPLFGYDYAAGRNHYYSKRNWLKGVGLEPLIINNMKEPKSD